MYIYRKLKSNFDKASRSHSYAHYSFLKVLVWKIGVLRRFLGELRRLSVLDFFRMTKLNYRFKISSPRPAFICATGPSINAIEKKTMKSFAEIGAIFSINHFPITKLGQGIHINYQMMLDAYHFNELNTDISETNFRKWFKLKFNGVLVTTFNSKPNFDGDVIRLNGLCLPSFTKSVNPMKIVGYQPYTVFYAVSLALWLGYSPVYLLGVDATHHSKINVGGTEVTLDRHHAYDANLDGLPWKGRPSVSSILNSNAYFIQQCQLFSKYPVFIIEGESHVDLLPRVSVDSILHRKYL
jgi:hypothetical protein